MRIFVNQENGDNFLNKKQLNGNDIKYVWPNLTLNKKNCYGKYVLYYFAIFCKQKKDGEHILRKKLNLNML